VGIRSTYPQTWSLSYQRWFLPHESPHRSLSDIFPLCHHAATRRAVICCQPSCVHRTTCVWKGVSPSSVEGVLLLFRCGVASWLGVWMRLSRCVSIWGRRVLASCKLRPGDFLLCINHLTMASFLVVTEGMCRISLMHF
jgi:hypothetical protein